MREILETFCDWLNVSEFPIQPWTNEKTIQNQLGLFLNYWLPRRYRVELEVNVTRLPEITQAKYGGMPDAMDLRKREADIIVTSNGERKVVEVKYWRDQGTYNIGMFRLYEDICFVEQLRSLGFATSGVLFITDIAQHYMRIRDRDLDPRNVQNTDLHRTFRVDQRLQGTVQIITGTLKDTITIAGTYPLEWRQLRDNTWYVAIEI